MVKIAPSLLSADFLNLAAEVRKAEEGGADWLHVDVMDGHFVPNLTIGPLVVEALSSATGLPLDVHLMIERPEDYINAFAKAGAAYLTVHVEACRHLHRVVHQIKEQGIKVGVSINPHTSVCQVEAILGEVDLVLVMSVNPGFGGQSFIPSVLPKIAELKRRAKEKGYNYLIEVDGGINVKTAPTAVQAGADILVAGSAVFAQSDVRGAIASLREAAGG